ncbi:MAG: hypothetical protein R2856_35610 [Caldilineaceae bacterium]
MAEMMENAAPANAIADEFPFAGETQVLCQLARQQRRRRSRVRPYIDNGHGVWCLPMEPPQIDSRTRLMNGTARLITLVESVWRR